MIKTVKWVLLSLFLLFHSTLYADHTEIRFGVFAYLGKEETTRKYKPLADYLSQVTGKKIILEVLTQEELEAKVALQELEILTTNPTHFLVLRQQYRFSGAIATLIGYSKGMATSKLGGTIVVRADSSIQSIHDIRGKKIATPSTKNMGGYRAQVYELFKHGIDVKSDNTTIIETKRSHQEVIYDVLNRKADVGFIRDGILEEMIDKGEIGASMIRVINEQKKDSHPYAISTALYPEWPVCALPNIDEEDVKLIISALFSIQPIHKELLDAGIYGYTLPADYLEVEQLSRDLRLPPFDKKPQITYRDIWENYDRHILTMVIVLVFGALYYGWVRSQKRLIETLLSNIGDGVYGVDQRGNCIWINDHALRMLQYTRNEVLGKDQHGLFHHHKYSGEAYPAEECPISKTLQDYTTRRNEDYFIRKNGEIFPVSLTVASTNNDGAIVVFQDITEQIAIRIELEKAKDALEEANQTLMEKNDQLKEWAMIDGLTQIANRRLFDETYEKHYLESIRSKKTLAVLMIDVDNFKTFNDHYGHAAGDMCLIQIAHTLRASLKRPTDVVARYGGEEFVILLNDIDVGGVQKVSHRILENVRALNIVHEFSNTLPFVTISIGYTFNDLEGLYSKDELLKQADDALYVAKANGKNQVFRYEISEIRSVLSEDTFGCIKDYDVL